LWKGGVRDGDKGELKDHPIKNVSFASGSDYFTALGWFQLSFTGSYCVSEGKVELKGDFTLTDLYDWQNPGNKYVTLAGTKIYDKYATLVEDNRMASPFKVQGRITNYSDNFPLTEDEPALDGGRSGR
jgi:hypothetical protein